MVLSKPHAGMILSIKMEVKKLPGENDENTNEAINEVSEEDNPELFDETENEPNNLDEINIYPKYAGECKFFCHEPYYTPNNYDLQFDHNNIPSNIEVESAPNLQKRLQRLMPLSKIIHLDMGTQQSSQTNFIKINTRLKVAGQEVGLI